MNRTIKSGAEQDCFVRNAYICRVINQKYIYS